MSSNYSVIEIGEDSDRWLVVSYAPVHQETMSIPESRLAVIETLRQQLIPGNEDIFADCVEEALDSEAHLYEYPILLAGERVCYRSPVGAGAPRAWERLGSCGVTFGFTLPDHHALEKEDL